MDKTGTQFDHVFRFKGRVVRLICSIEEQASGRRLILHDVLATTVQTANDVTDQRIEWEASIAAARMRARYL